MAKNYKSYGDHYLDKRSGTIIPKKVVEREKIQPNPHQWVGIYMQGLYKWYQNKSLMVSARQKLDDEIRY